MKADAPSLQYTRLIAQVHERVRNMHYSLNIVKYYVFELNYFFVDQPMSKFNAPSDRGAVWQIAENAD
jgi:hypothetical protein